MSLKGSLQIWKTNIDTFEQTEKAHLDKIEHNQNELATAVQHKRQENIVYYTNQVEISRQNLKEARRYFAKQLQLVLGDVIDLI